MQNFMQKSEVVSELFEACPILKENAYVVATYESRVQIQADYNYKLVQELISKYEFEFEVSKTGFVESSKRLMGFDFDIEITLT